MNLGDEALAAGNTAGAADYYQKSLQIKGNNPEVIYKLGMAYVTARGSGDCGPVFYRYHHELSEFRLCG